MKCEACDRKRAECLLLIEEAARGGVTLSRSEDGRLLATGKVKATLLETLKADKETLLWFLAGGRCACVPAEPIPAEAPP